MKRYLQFIIVISIFFLIVWAKQFFFGSNDQLATTTLKSSPDTQQETPTPSSSSDNSVMMDHDMGNNMMRQYKNGIYEGKVADAFYGLLQVEVTVSGGKISNIEFLQYPDDNATSIAVNQQALRHLESEAIAAQSADIDIVSGASESSVAFRQSLASALEQAK